VSSAFAFDGAAFKPLDWQPQRTMRWAAWRPDGATVLAVGNGGSALLSDGSSLDEIATGTKQNFRGAAWSPDGSTALLVGNRGAVFRQRAGSMTELAAVTSENLRRVAWHPSGEYALVVGNNGVVLRYEASSEALWPLPGDRAHTLRSVAFRPDGAYALIGAYASRHAGYPRPQPLYRCDGRYFQALLASDDEDDFVSIDWSLQSGALVSGYAWRPDGSLVNKALLYDGTSWQTHVWEAKGVVLGGAWRPGHPEALLVGEAGMALRLALEGGIEALDAGTQDNLVGPFWKPDGSWALILKGPSERVYTV
jgi:WD40 repeat protein